MDTNLLTPTRISSDRFTYSGGMFVIEASDLGRLDRVYRDACDVGFTIVSARTGREVVFAEESPFRDGEGELLYTEFVSVTPGHRGIKARVFND
jgi:hypothetical protein